MAAYSRDLRKRVARSCDRGMPVAAVAAQFEVSVAWVYRLLQRRRETGSITLLWDSSPDPEVVGYRVYIGTESGVYPETVDVSAYQTSFVFTRASEPKSYYFAVASLAAVDLIGPAQLLLK